MDSDEPEDAAATLAGRYLDAWEEALLAAARDPALALELFRALMIPTAAATVPGEEAAWSDAWKTLMQEASAGNKTAGPDRVEDEERSEKSVAGDRPKQNREPTPGSTAAGAPPGDCAQRLAELEARLAALEAAFAARSQDRNGC